MLCWWLWWEARKKEVGKAVNNPISLPLPSSVLYIMLAAKGRCLRQKNTMKSTLLPPTLSNNVCSWWDVSFLQFSCFLNKWIYTFHWVLPQVKNWLNTLISWALWSCSSFIKAAIKHIYWAVCVREVKMNRIYPLIAESAWLSSEDFCMCQSVGLEKWIYSDRAVVVQMCWTRSIWSTVLVELLPSSRSRGKCSAEGNESSDRWAEPR